MCTFGSLSVSYIWYIVSNNCLSDNVVGWGVGGSLCVCVCVCGGGGGGGAFQFKLNATLTMD